MPDPCGSEDPNHRQYWTSMICYYLCLKLAGCDDNGLDGVGRYQLVAGLRLVVLWGPAAAARHQHHHRIHHNHLHNNIRMNNSCRVHSATTSIIYEFHLDISSSLHYLRIRIRTLIYNLVYAYPCLPVFRIRIRNRMKNPGSSGSRVLKLFKTFYLSIDFFLLEKLISNYKIILY